MLFMPLSLARQQRCQTPGTSLAHAVISPQLRTVRRWVRDRFDPAHHAHSSRRHFMTAKNSHIALKNGVAKFAVVEPN
jgi:hypothetical protein